MKYEEIDSCLFRRNRERLAGLLPAGSLAVVWSNDILPTNADGVLPFVQHRDFFYLTGVDQEDCALIFYPDCPDPAKRELLFIQPTSEHLKLWEGEKLSRADAQRISGIENIMWLDDFESVLHTLAPACTQIFLATNEHTRACRRIETRNDRFIQQCRSWFPLHQYGRLAPLMAELRSVKDEVELSQIKQAIDITAAGFRRVLHFLKPGVGEWEVEAEWAHEFLRRRSRGFAYQPIIASGANACVLHYIKNDQRCADGDLVLMDVGAEWANWNADLTRTLPANGTFTPRQAEVYDAVLRVLRTAFQLLRPGLTLPDYQNQVLRVMEGELESLGLIAPSQKGRQDDLEAARRAEIRRYFPHGTSHHLGLDVHDVAPPHARVQVGMVFTIEPGIYIPEEKLGIRLENNVLIGEHENQDLFAEIPIEREDIEALMAENVT